MPVILNIEDLRQRARRRLPGALFDYIEGGSYDEVTLRANRADFDAVRLRQKILVDVSGRSLATSVFGQPLSMPVILGPVGSLGAFSRQGEIAAARAAERCGINSCLATGSICSIEEVRAARERPFWFQLYLGNNREHAESLVERAQKAACTVLVVTIDAQIYAAREQSVRNGFAVPLRIGMRNALDLARRWNWIFDVALGPPLKFGNFPGGRRNLHPVLRQTVGGGMNDTMSWKDIDWLRSLWKGPFVIKGVLSADDAKRALDHGAQGIVVSNHGGRQLDGAPSSISVLPEIAQAVNGRMSVLLDSGVRRGQDVIKALALGAQACLLGRAYAYGLAAMGEAGVEKAIRILEAEMHSTLGFLGLRSVAELDSSALEPARGGR